MRTFSIAIMACLLGATVVGDAPLWLSAPAPVFLAGLWMARRDRCEHLYPALVPAVRQPDGTTLPPRWLCSDCGASWA